MSELALREYARVYDLKISILRVFSVFGPGLRKQLFWDLSQLAHKAHAKGERTIVLQGAGTESRDFIFAKDVAKAALHIAHRVASSGFEIFNIGSGRETEIQDAASQLITHLNLNIDLAFDGNVRPGVPRNWRADVTKLSESGFSPEVSFNEGIGLVATWLKNDYSSSS
jgi:UDP-glucose 4-epimerase